MQINLNRLCSKVERSSHCCNWETLGSPQGADPAVYTVLEQGGTFLVTAKRECRFHILAGEMHKSMVAQQPSIWECAAVLPKTQQFPVNLISDLTLNAVSFFYILLTSISVRLVTLGSKSRLTVVYGSFVPRHQSVGGSPGEPTEVLLMFSHIVVVFM